MYLDFGAGFPSFLFFADVAGAQARFLFTSVTEAVDPPSPLRADELLPVLSADKDVPINSLGKTQQEATGRDNNKVGWCDRLSHHCCEPHQL